jgi:hypothetical protein
VDPGDPAAADPALDWWRVLITAILIGAFWVLLVPARTILMSRGWAPVVVAPWLASFPHWVPGEPLGLGPGFGTGLTGWTLQHPVLTVRLVAKRLHQRAAGSMTITAVRVAFHEWWELESKPPTQSGASVPPLSGSGTVPQ